MKKSILLLFLCLAAVPAGAQVMTGIEVLREEDFEPLAGKSVGLITNPTGVDSHMVSTIDILNSPAARKAGVRLAAMFAPEHGVRGNIAAGEAVGTSVDPSTGITVHSLYGNGHKPKPEMLKGIDVLVFDIQDIGSRSYTFISTLGLAMEAAAENGVEFMVLDRPNPLGGHKVEGVPVEKGFSSFVSKYPIPYIHGMTVGELARLYNGEGMLKGGVKCNLSVIEMEGWEREMTFGQTGLPWVPTSPHIPHATTPTYYPVTGMIGELGVLNIGVGYTMPFELFGAVWIDKAETLAANLNALGLNGVVFRPIHYKPFYGGGKDKDMHGVQVVVTSMDAPLTLIPFYVVQEIVAMYPSRSPFAAASEKQIDMFDKVMGCDWVRKQFVAGGHKVDAIKDRWVKSTLPILQVRSKYLLYRNF